MKRIYLDYAAATPLHPRVREAMEPYFIEIFGNPSSVHSEGRQARMAVERAREQVATLLHARPEGIVYTSGTTESVNMAISGVQKKLGGKIALQKTEHHAGLRHADGEAVLLEGDISPESLLSQDVSLLSLMWANNETGTLADVHRISVQLQKCERDMGRRPLLHSDIAQAILTEEISCERTPVDLLSFGAAKIYGPKGVGALFVRKGTPFLRSWSGGNQEGGRRPGTENVPGIVGFGEACVMLSEGRARQRVHIQACKDAFLHALKKSGIEMRVNGGEHTVPHIVNITFFAVDAEEFVMRLDASGIAASAASACKRAGERSHVLRALGMSEGEIKSTVRFSFGDPLSILDASSAGALTGEVLKRMIS